MFSTCLQPFDVTCARLADTPVEAIWIWLLRAAAGSGGLWFAERSETGPSRRIRVSYPTAQGRKKLPVRKPSLKVNSPSTSLLRPGAVSRPASIDAITLSAWTPSGRSANSASKKAPEWETCPSPSALIRFAPRFGFHHFGCPAGFGNGSRGPHSQGPTGTFQEGSNSLTLRIATRHSPIISGRRPYFFSEPIRGAQPPSSTLKTVLRYRTAVLPVEPCRPETSRPKAGVIDVDISRRLCHGRQ